MASLVGLEPTTTCLEGRCSIQLSYRDILANVKQYGGCGWTRTNKLWWAAELQSAGLTNSPTHP